MKHSASIVLMLVVTLFTACKKDPDYQVEPFVDPPMTYVDLTGKTLDWNGSLVIDIDKNGKAELVFATEQHSYDGNTKVRNQYMVYGATSVRFCIELESGITPAFQTGEKITNANIPGLEWHPVNAPVFMLEIFAGANHYWEGNWVDRGRRYLAIQMAIAGKLHNAWIEMEADTTTKQLRFYRAAYAQQPEVAIRAGH